MTAPQRTGFNYEDGGGEGRGGFFEERPHLPYLIPFFCFVVFFLPSMFGGLGGVDWEKLWFRWHPYIYFLKTVTAAVLLGVFWKYYTKIRWTNLSLGAVVGLVGTVVWVGSAYLTYWLGISHPPNPSTVFNPDVMIPDEGQRWLFFFVRVAGPTLVVPIMEELLFRDFLMRTVIHPANFLEVAVGKYSMKALLIMSAFFAVNHGVQMLVPGFLYGLMMGIWVIRTKSLGSCIVAHGVTNFTLYLYCIWAGDWQFM